MKKRLSAKFTRKGSSKTNVTAVARAPTPPKERSPVRTEPPARAEQPETSEQTWNEYKVVLPTAAAPSAAAEKAADDALSEYTYTYDEIPADELAADQQIDEFADQLGNGSEPVEPVERSSPGGAVALGVAKTPQMTPGVALSTPHRAPNTCSSTAGAPSHTPGSKTALAQALADEGQRPARAGSTVSTMAAKSPVDAAAMAAAAAATGEAEGEEEAEYYSDEDETVEVVSHRTSAPTTAAGAVEAARQANIDSPGRLSIKERMAALERASSSEKVPSQGARDFPEPPQGRPAATASSPSRGGEATPVAAAGATVKIEATTRPDPEATLAKPNPFQALGEQIKDAFGAMLCVQKRKPGAPPARKGCF